MTQAVPVQQPQPPKNELAELGQQIVADQRRIAQMQNPSSSQLATEMSGTVLAYVRDLTGYVARLEHAIGGNFNAVFSMIAEGPPRAEDDEETGTQFDEADAAKFADFITGTKVLCAAIKDSAGTSPEVRAQVEKMLATADELLALIDETTLVDEDEDGEAGESEAQPAQMPGGATP